MTPEYKQIPDWARQERDHDLGWIGHNLHVFWPVANAAYEEVGHGAIVVDTTDQPIPGGGYPFWYFTQTELEEHNDEDIKRMVREYDPAQEIVLVLQKTGDRTSTYRMRRQLRQSPGDPDK